MIVHRPLCYLFLALGLLAAAASPVSAEDYRDAERHFTIKLPEGWGLIPADALAKVTALLKQRIPGSTVNYSTGFQLVHQPPMSYPYILVQPTSYARANPSYEQLEASLARESK